VTDYEILLMLDPELPDERQTQIVTRAREAIERDGGSFDRHEPWGRRRLAYEIAHKPEGLYHLLTFDAEPATLDELSRILRITDGVMRHMPTRRIARASEPRRAGAEPEPEPAEAEPERESAAPDDAAEPAGLGIALGALAETALYAGDPAARDHLLAAARAHRRAGRTSAALDACDLAIAVAPSDVDLHVLLAELYLDRGWRPLAIEKVVLLGRLAELDGDSGAHERLRELVAERLADEPRLAERIA